MEHTLPLTVSLATYGTECKLASAAGVPQCFEDKFAVMDVREYLQRDPMNFVPVGKGEDGSFMQTQRAVFAQDGPVQCITVLLVYFRNVVYKHVRGVLSDDEKNVVLRCRAGRHRAYVTGAFMADILNNLITNDGRRIFNCQMFSLSTCYGKSDIAETIQRSLAWAEDIKNILMYWSFLWGVDLVVYTCG